ncbi:hypothetical protein SNEBB_006082, partial [Seison nebaliae]
QVKKIPKIIRLKFSY